MENFVEVALSYAAKGNQVFPCQARGKEPLIKGWQNKATTDEGQIRAWWDKWPEANIGLPTGKANGFWALDVDGEEGRESYLKYQGDIPHDTPNVKTPSGGFHLYFAYDDQAEKLRNSVKSIPGVDVRTEGGYVVAVGSVLEDGQYEYLNSWREPTQAPERLVRDILRASERGGITAPVERTIPEGQRNSTLFCRARSLFAQGYNDVVVSTAISALNRSACIPPLPDNEVMDIVESAGSDKYSRGELIPSKDGYTREPNKNGHKTSTGSELLSKAFKPVNWAVPDILPEGVTLFSGKAKLGKSWLALGLCVAVATGGYALGKKPVEHGESLYLALEDNERRLQERMRTQVSEGTDLSRFHYATEWPKLNEGGLKDLDSWLMEHPDTRLVVIDTLKRVRPKENGRRNIYDVDYEALQPLGPLAANHNISIMVVHHNNKMVDPDDPFDAISGSTGLTGSVDGVLILNRERGRADAFLYVDGRDIKEQGELALSWDQQVCTWTLQGDAEQYRMSQERQEICRVIEEAGEPVGPSHVADDLDKNLSTTKNLMLKMARDGQLNNDNGKYSVDHVGSVDRVNSVDRVDQNYTDYGATEGVDRVGPDSNAENGASDYGDYKDYTEYKWEPSLN
jgi:hypothetical protein